MQYEVVVKGDTNDADYITKTTTIDESEVPRLRAVIDYIKAHGKAHEWRPGLYRWGTSEYADETLGQIFGLELDGDEDEDDYEFGKLPPDIEWFNDKFVPYGEYGIHTLENVVIYPLPVKEKLL